MRALAATGATRGTGAQEDHRKRDHGGDREQRDQQQGNKGIQDGSPRNGKREPGVSQPAALTKLGMPLMAQGLARGEEEGYGDVGYGGAASLGVVARVTVTNRETRSA